MDRPPAPGAHSSGAAGVVHSATQSVARSMAHPSASHAAPTVAATGHGPFGHTTATSAGMYGGVQATYGGHPRSGGVGGAAAAAGGQMGLQQQMAQMAQMAQLAQQQAAMYQLYGAQQAGQGQAPGQGQGRGPGQPRGGVSGGPGQSGAAPAWGYGGGMYGAGGGMAGVPFGAGPGAMAGPMGAMQDPSSAMGPGVAQAAAAGLNHMPLAYTLAFMRRFANDGGRGAPAGRGADMSGMPFAVPFMGAAPAASDGFRKRKRASQACLRCRRRKQRCSGSQPCNLCMRAGVACEFSAVSDRRRRRRTGSNASATKAAAAATPESSEDNGVIGSAEQSELWEYLSLPMLVPLTDVAALKELVASPKAWARGSGNTAAQSVILATAATAVSRVRGAASAKPYFFRARQQLAASMTDTPSVWTLYAAVQMVLFADDVMSDPVLAAGLRSFITSVVTSVTEHDAKLRFALSFALARSGSGEALPATPWPEDDPDAFLGATLGQMTRVLLKHAAGSCSRDDFAVATNDLLKKTKKAESEATEKRSVPVSSFVQGVRVLAELATADAEAGRGSDSEAEQRPVAAIELARKAWSQTKHVFACSPLSVEYAALGYALASAFCDAGEADADATRAMPLITATVQASSRCFPGIRAIASSMADAATPRAAAEAVRGADADESKEPANGSTNGEAAAAATTPPSGSKGVHSSNGSAGGGSDGDVAVGAASNGAVATQGAGAASATNAGRGGDASKGTAATSKAAGYATDRFSAGYGADVGQRYGFYGSMYQGRPDSAPFMMPAPTSHGAPQPYYVGGPTGQPQPPSGPGFQRR